MTEFVTLGSAWEGKRAETEAEGTSLFKVRGGRSIRKDCENEHLEKYGTSGGLGPKEEEFLNIDSNQAGLIFLCHVREQKKLEVIYPEFLKESWDSRILYKR